jgi:cell wall-associated NlpC family hydrolase
MLLLFSFISASAQPSAPTTAVQGNHVVIRPVANMYRDANTDSDVVSQAILGSNVKVLEAKGDWLQVQTADEYKGWVQAGDLRQNSKPYAAEGKVVRVAQLSANVYKTPDVTEHAPIVNAPWETRLEVVNDKVDQRGRWLQVKLPDDRLGYIQNGDVSSDFTPLNIDQTIATAKRFMGVTYTWGGTSAFGYDCSGFMQMLVRQRGIIMPRDADIQAAWSGVMSIERKDLKPGDLLYFGASEKKITHTGMYIGNGEFIHDTTNTHPMVQISKLDDMPWTKLLVAARRVKQ